MRSRDLTVHCMGMPGHAVHIHPEPTAPVLSVSTIDLTEQDDQGHCAPGGVIYLDEAGARELFNWLGVWLHKR